jgi:hypothetical protein
LLLLSKKNHVGTHDAWALAWGLGAPVALRLYLSARHIPAHTWRLGSCLSVGHTLRTRGTEILLSVRHALHAHGAWALAWGLGTLPAHTWPLGYASVLGTSHHTRGAWACASVVGTPLRTRGAELLPQCCAHVALGLLSLCWAHLFSHVALWLSAWVLDTPQRTRGAWVRQDVTILGPCMLQNPK